MIGDALSSMRSTIDRVMGEGNVVSTAMQSSSGGHSQNSDEKSSVEKASESVDSFLTEVHGAGVWLLAKALIR